jgi:hypothetical protein
MRLREGVGTAVVIMVVVVVVVVMVIRLRLDEDLSSYEDVHQSGGLRRLVLSACGAIDSRV